MRAGHSRQVPQGHHGFQISGRRSRYRRLRTRHTYLAVFATGVLGWLAYGLVAAQPAVFAANVVTFTLIAALTLLKTRPRRPPR